MRPLLRRLLFTAMALVAAAPAAAEPLSLTIVEARAGADAATGLPVVTLTMSAESASAFAAFTGQNVGRRVALMVDGETVSAPVVREPILGDVVQISGSIAGLDGARALAARLAAGSAHVSVDVVPE
jgi:preprotein translocase subunit SecD